MDVQILHFQKTDISSYQFLKLINNFICLFIYLFLVFFGKFKLMCWISCRKKKLAIVNWGSTNNGF